MIRHTFIVILRTLRKNKVFSLINIIGLAVGLAAGLLILQYVYFERSFDQFHTEKNQLFRVGYTDEARDAKSSVLPHTVAPQLESEVSQVKKSTRLWEQNGTLVIQGSIEQASFKQTFVYTDANFFSMFDFPMLFGERTEVLAGLKSVVITESVAQKFFGEVDQDILGNTVTLYHMFGPQQYQVTGIAEDFPANSHIDQEIFFSFDVIDNGPEYLRYWSAFTTYALLHQEASPQQVSSVVNTIMKNANPEDSGELTLEPIAQTYLHSEYGNSLGSTGNAQIIYIFSIIAVFLVVIAWINYLNLVTAQATERAKEVGIRKVVGSQRVQLISQFLLEALLFNVVSALLALTIFQLSLPAISDLLGKEIQTVHLFGEPLFWLAFILAIIVGSVVSGLYPAWVLSSYQPIAVLKGSFSNSRQGISLRKTLMVLQFVASVALVGGTYVVFQQLNFMRNRSLGLNIEETLIISSPAIVDDNSSGKMASLKTEISRFPFVKSVVFSGNVPGKSYNYNVQAALPGEDFNEAHSYSILEIDDQYITEYQIPLVAGRNYNDTLSQESERLLINETAVQLLGFGTSEDAIGKLIKVGNSEELREIIGVVTNYHHKSLKNAYEPIIFNYRPENGILSVKIDTDYASTPVAAVISSLKEEYLTLFPGNPFEYYFLDEQFDSLYQEDQRIGQVFAIFSGLAIFIAGLGLFGLTSFSVAQKTKEIGIRKVLGASVASLLRLLSRDFAQLMLLALAIGIPIVFWIMREWLDNYAFSIDYSITLFLVPSGLVFLIGMLIVSTQTVKAAQANPIESLRYE
ncbi:ABC transporter permease [Tunicatimonas pelagia]|uniref:ABC transporter permease n=1 Tax=Tunicatimonas pelagia TaxID=931531 RepID=UPI002666F2C9|nr:FtsX-like permease family protein [Tunicatimonas pelagia]WKN43622.1 ABC transporter permease [Tunicatimonas pelagia]